MPTKRPTHQTGRSGEYFVAAELNRRGYDALVFSGNMPWVDVVAVPSNKVAIYLQVKTQTGSGWALNINERLRDPVPNTFWVLVLLPKTTDNPPRYWVIPDGEMRGIIQGQYEARKASFDRNAAKNNFHCKLSETAVAEWKDNWDRLG